MIPHRISAKYFVKDPASVELPALIPVFHRWIQERRVDELLIDVVDYKHVHEGPGIMLIGHEADYALGQEQGRPGLLYSRKRQLYGDLREMLRTVFRQVLHGCHLLENEPSLQGRIIFRTDEVDLAFLDRLLVPNQPELLDRVRDDLEVVLAEVYGGVGFSLEWIDTDPRQAFSVRVRVPEAADLATLIDRLQTESAWTNGYAS